MLGSHFPESTKPKSIDKEHTVPKTIDTDLLKQAKKLFELPLMKLVRRASVVHEEHWPVGDIQRCSLLSIKTGNCPEGCSYCPQSARYSTEIEKHALMDTADIVEKAKTAKANGSTRFCMGAAWRKPPRGKQFDSVLETVREVKSLGMEVCATLGLLNDEQAVQLKEAGLDVYNHNADTSPSHYKKVITTRQFEDRVETLQSVRAAGLEVCCGGILGMGETATDRTELIAFLAGMNPQPESVPLNLLVAVEGTPLAQTEELDSLDFVRTVAVARILLPKTRLRLSAGRMKLSREAQTLAFFAGANSIFSGEKLLTTPLPGSDEDDLLISELTGTPSRDSHENSPHLQ